MKRIIFTLASVAALTACTSRENCIIDSIDIPIQNTEGVFTYTMTMNEDAKPKDDTLTRATSTGEWEHQDSICIYFGGVNSAYAEGVYDRFEKVWRVFSQKSLVPTTSDVCSIIYYKGVNKHQKLDDNKWSYYDYLTDYYSSEAGSYSFNGNEIRISAKLERPYWRLRFKGQPGSIIRLDSTGISHAVATYRFSQKWSGSVIRLTVNNDGYTDYFIGKTDIDCNIIEITCIETEYSFEHYFDDHSLKKGESGSFSIPNLESLCGWERSSNHPYVDLGLPSGLLWATCNVGSDYPYEKGHYYAWGEIEEKEVYDWATYRFCNGNSSTITKYNESDKLGILELCDDVASVKWGGNWRIPVVSDFQELYKNCTHYDTELNGEKGILFISDNNGRSIFFPNTGHKGNAAHNSTYWTSELRKTYITKAYPIFDGGDFYGTQYTCDRCIGLTIRPVLVPQ